jgi:hypothetical protein
MLTAYCLTAYCFELPTAYCLLNLRNLWIPRPAAATISKKTLPTREILLDAIRE